MRKGDLLRLASACVGEWLHIYLCYLLARFLYRSSQ